MASIKLENVIVYDLEWRVLTNFLISFLGVLHSLMLRGELFYDLAPSLIKVDFRFSDPLCSWSLPFEIDLDSIFNVM